jgi:hypothetical protein
MTKLADSVFPKSKLGFRMPPGSPTPRSGIDDQVGPRGGQNGRQADAMNGTPLLPTASAGRGWVLVDPAKTKSGNPG